MKPTHLEAQAAARYRQPMQVTSVMMFQRGSAYPVCPQCGVTMEREYQNFCDRCGQRLDCAGYCSASVIRLS